MCQTPVLYIGFVNEDLNLEISFYIEATTLYR